MVTQEFAPYEAKVYMQGRLVTNITGLEMAGVDNSQFLPTLNKIMTVLGKGTQSFTVTLELMQSEYEALLNTVPVGKSLLDKGLFDITVTYVPEDNVGLTTTRRIKKVKINNFAESIRAGELRQTVRLSAICQKIERG